jgi:hypothetical protein
VRKRWDDNGQAGLKRRSGGDGRISSPTKKHLKTAIDVGKTFFGWIVGNIFDTYPPVLPKFHSVPKPPPRHSIRLERIKESL